ncbi:hypothetical protein KQH82_03125 [bacterium]|nr:hypothetical protein [bacterium]
MNNIAGLWRLGIGSHRRFVPTIVLAQSMFLVAAGAVLAFALFPLLQRALESMTPEMTILVEPRQFLLVGISALFIAVISAVPSVAKAQSFYAEEAFL